MLTRDIDIRIVPLLVRSSVRPSCSGVVSKLLNISYFLLRLTCEIRRVVTGQCCVFAFAVSAGGVPAELRCVAESLRTMETRRNDVAWSRHLLVLRQWSCHRVTPTTIISRWNRVTSDDCDSNERQRLRGTNYYGDMSPEQVPAGVQVKWKVKRKDESRCKGGLHVKDLCISAQWSRHPRGVQVYDKGYFLQCHLHANVHA